MEVFKRELRKCINYYNNDRIKLNGKSPVQYRTLSHQI
ncbi:MAG: IS3 family transposase [Alistipes sp.]|nr:IS3 family transposase [Alistipes sp.]